MSPHPTVSAFSPGHPHRNCAVKDKELDTVHHRVLDKKSANVWKMWKKIQSVVFNLPQYLRRKHKDPRGAAGMCTAVKQNENDRLTNGNPPALNVPLDAYVAVGLSVITANSM